MAAPGSSVDFLNKGDAAAAAGAMPLIDHHCHSVARQISDRGDIEKFLSESGRPAPAGCTHFDSMLGVAVVRRCAPFLDLPPDATPDEYVVRRLELGAAEVNRRLMASIGVESLIVDDGYSSVDLVSVEELGRLAEVPAHRIVRLESVAEQLGNSLSDAAGFAEAFDQRLAAELSGPDGAIGCKSIVAYRIGLDFDPRPPGPAEVARAAGEWLAGANGGAPSRLEHPVLLRHLVWCGLRTRLPVQFHTGYGDRDEDVRRCDPALLTELIRMAEPLETPIMLLHCYPFHRQAAYLAGVFPNVYLDVGLATNYVGHRAGVVLAEALEVSPFHKLLYSSDALGLPELHLLGAMGFRRALSEALQPLEITEIRSKKELGRIASLIGAGTRNASHRLRNDLA